MYAHARGVPKSLFACLDGPSGQPTGFNSEGGCTTHNPLFHVPRSSAGVADVPGGDFIISLGFWDGFVGTDFVQASTTMHELGHNLERWHGGDPPQFSSVAPGVSSAPEDRVILFEPNCKPNYLSVMSYLFQVRGLLDDAGDPHLSYSSQVIDPLDETSLGSGVTMPGPYRTAWFAPRVPGTLGHSLGIPAAKRFCPGSNFPDPLPTNPPWVDYTRIDATGVSALIDWDADGNPSEPATQDVNFGGSLDLSPVSGV